MKLLTTVVAILCLAAVGCSGGSVESDGEATLGATASDPTSASGAADGTSDASGTADSTAARGSGPDSAVEATTADAGRPQVLVATVPSAGLGQGSTASSTAAPDQAASSTTTSLTSPASTASSVSQPAATGSTSSTSAPSTTPAAPTSTVSTGPVSTGPVSTGAPSTTSLVPSDDPANPIAVPAGLFGGVTTSGPARCIFADLRSVPVPPNPGYVGESVDGQTITGDELWAITFYLMLYSNCERQARGLEPFRMYPADKQLAMQQTVLGISESHGGFGDRADIAGGLAAEGHGGGPRPGEPINHDNGEDTNGDGFWSVDEIGRRSASGNRNNGNAGLVDHGNAMIDPKYTCIFAAASLGPTADHRVDVIIFYGNRC
ncbi:MAG: hypothetical protein AAGA93_16855 [Actinomycetota bacterium]